MGLAGILARVSWAVERSLALCRVLPGIVTGFTGGIPCWLVQWLAPRHSSMGQAEKLHTHRAGGCCDEQRGN